MNQITKFGFALFVACAAITANATVKTFTGASEYTMPDSADIGFNDLEQLGVREAAELNAVNSCNAAGAMNCVILSSAITKCNVWDINQISHCAATAVVRGDLN